MAQRQHVADDAHLHASRPGDEGGGQDSAGGIDVEVGEVVLIDESAIKP